MNPTAPRHHFGDYIAMMSAALVPTLAIVAWGFRLNAELAVVTDQVRTLANRVEQMRPLTEETIRQGVILQSLQERVAKLEGTKNHGGDG